MISKHALTEKEQNIAQWIYIKYAGVNSVAIAFGGVTIQVLLALYLGIGDAGVSCLGAFEYLKYIFLPLGFVFTGKSGLTKCLQTYTRINFVMYLLLALAALSPLAGLQKYGIPVFFFGLTLLCCTSACGVAMLFPLQKNITSDHTLSRFVSRGQAVNAMASLLGSLAIAGLFALWTNEAVLPLLFCMASGLALLSGFQIIRMPEPLLLKEQARRPVFAQVKTAWKEPVVRRILWVGTVQNLVFVTMVPVNILAVKRGCHANNVQVLILTCIQLVSTIIAARFYRSFTGHFSVRKVMIATCPFVWMIAAYWCLVPVQNSFFLLIPPFVLSSVLSSGFACGMGNYIVSILPNELQIGSTFLVYLFHGALAGLIGIAANPALFTLISAFIEPENSMLLYRWYYLITGLISLPGILAFFSLPEEKRKVQ